MVWMVKDLVQIFFILSSFYLEKNFTKGEYIFFAAFRDYMLFPVSQAFVHCSILQYLLITL